MNTLVKHLDAIKEIINPLDSALFLLPEQVRQKHHTLGQKLAWIETVKISTQAWHQEGGITLGDGAWIHLAHQI